MVKITSVTHASYAAKAGILSGDMLISVCGNDIKDVLDYRFHIINKTVDVEVERDGKTLSFKLKKRDEYDDIGLEFETYLMDEKHSCRNKCIFCFIDQNPKGMRDSIYFKDDDSRLSFFFGNYVTLTNLTDEEVERIIKMRITPVNISVHTTNPDLRCKMMNNRFAGDSLRYLKRFADGDIGINCQIVLCKGYNDGEELVRSIKDLSALYPHVQSIAVVPAGLTGHREGLCALEPFSAEEAGNVIEVIEKLGEENLEKLGERLVFASDEWYLDAERPLPHTEYYEEYPQLDNGVGMIRSMDDEIAEELEYIAEDGGMKLPGKRRISIATGESAYDFIKSSAKRVCDCIENLECNVYSVKNEFFGGSVTVAGLVTGSDLFRTLSGKDLGDELLIPSVMLRHEGDLFLDDMSLAELSESLGVKITPVENTGNAFVTAMTGVEENL